MGTHRRVRRGDIEAIRTRTQRLTRDQRRSLWQAYAVGSHLVKEPERVLSIARENVERMRASTRGRASFWLDEWAGLLDEPVGEILDAYTSRAPKGRALRQSSPFAGVLDEEERRQVLEHGESTNAP